MQALRRQRRKTSAMSDANTPSLSDWQRAAARSAPGGDVGALDWVTPEGCASSRCTPPPTCRACRTPTRCRASRPSCAARRRRCTRCGLGRSASTRAFPPPRPRTPSTARRWPAAAQGVSRGLRPGHAPRLRQRPPARHRRRRQGRRGDRLGRGHEDPVRRHSARQGERVDDDERRRAAGAGGLRRRGRRAGRGAGPAVAGPSRTTSSRSSWSATPTSTRRRRACGSSADIIEYTAQKMPKFNSISHLRLPHAGGRREPGARTGLHAGRRQGVREDGDRQGPGRRRLRAAPVASSGRSG